MDRRNFLIRSIGAAICVGLAPPLITSLLSYSPIPDILPPLGYEDTDMILRMLKEIYGNGIRDIVYADNPFFSMVRKTSEYSGKYFPIPLILESTQ